MRLWIAAVVVVLGLAACERPRPGSSTAPLPAAPGGALPDCDVDGDGALALACGGDDCDDRAPEIRPGLPERCDGVVDENCSGEVDEGCACSSGAQRACGPAGLHVAKREHGACRDGVQFCDDAGRWSSCEGAVGPSPEGEGCDGLDQDCDGVADQGRTNACGGCGPVPEERCGNGLDDDCDGEIDPGWLCAVHCGGVDPEHPPDAVACCVGDPDGGGLLPSPDPWSTRCVEHPGVAPCATRPCVDLDGDPATRCVAETDGTGVRRCLREDADGGRREDDGCGFPTPCAWQDCADRTAQPCYSGPPPTLGVGACHGGRADCAPDAATGVREWGACDGEVLPAPERCGDGVDDDCDGLVDEEDGATGLRCATTGRCAPGAVERCGDGLDGDCDGFVDEGCPADGPSQPCFGGPLSARNLGLCRDGAQLAVGGVWAACVGQVLPAPERCGDGLDSDCDGAGGPGAQEDDSCCVASGPEESCNGVDDDCDGLVDEGVVDVCGGCGAACFEQRLDPALPCGPGAEGTCDAVAIDPLAPDSFTIDDSKLACPGSTGVFFAVQGVNQIAKLDSVTGQKLWQVDSHGSDPSRLAVACDGSVWVGNRGFTDSRSPTFSNAVHLDASGALICVAPIAGLVRGVAIDPHGDVWVGTYETNRVYRVSGDQLDGTFLGQPACRIHDLAPGEPDELGLDVGVPIYGLSIDERGVLWTGSGPTARIDTNTLAFELVEHSDSYGLTIDDADGVWFGGSSGIHRLVADPPYVNPAQYQLMSSATGIYTVAAARDGAIWGTDLGGNRIVRLDPTTMRHQQWTIPNGSGSSPHGISEDAYGKIWTSLMSGGYALRFDPATAQFDAFEVDAGMGLYSQGELTSERQKRLQARTTRWGTVLDGGAPRVDWQTLRWSSRVPRGASVRVRVRFGDTKAALAATPWSCERSVPAPIELAACGWGQRRRYLEVEFELTAIESGEAPVVADVTLLWTRP